MSYLVILPNANSNIMDIDKDDQYILKARFRDGGFEPALKKLKRVYTEMEIVLRQTTEMVMVLVGVASLRGGAPPNPLECQLANKLYEKMVTLVTILAPQDLVPNDVLQSLIQQLMVPLSHPMRLVAVKIGSIQPQSSHILSITSTSSPSPLPSSTIVVSKALTQETEFLRPPSPSPSPLPSPATLTSFLNMSTPSMSIISSSQTFKSQIQDHKASTTLATIATTSKVVTPIPKIVEPMPSSLLKKTKALEDVQTSSISLKKCVSPSMISSTNTNVIGWMSPVKLQALPSINAQSTTTMTTIFINDQKRSQALKVMAREQGLKNLVSNEPPSIVLDSQQTHKQLALAVHHLLKPHITTPRLEKSALKYINIPVPCSICKIVVNTTINVLVCDGCECVFHLQCLQLSSSQSISKNDWYCQKCIMINVGQPQAPKYGPLQYGLIGAPKAKN